MCGGCCGKSPKDEPIEREKITNIEEQVNRSCRDIFCCLLFLAFIAGMVVVAGFGLSMGDPRKILYPVDYQGSICGVNNADVSSTTTTRDLSTKPYLYWPTLGNFTAGICITSCPSDSTTNITNYIEGTTVTSYVTAQVWKWCIPTVNSTFASNALSAVQTPTSTFTQAFSEVAEVWYVILGAFGVAIVLGFFWICCMRCYAGCMVWLSILAMFALLIVLDFILWFNWAGVDISVCATLSGCASGVSAVIDNASSSNSTALLVFAIAASVITVIFLLAICCCCTRIRLAIQLVKEAAKAIAAMPCLVFFPIFMLILIGAYLCYWVFVAVYLASAGTISYSGGTFSYSANEQLQYAMIYHLFGLLWIVGFLLAVGYTTIAGAVGVWYFQYPDPVTNKKSAPSYAITRAFFRTFRYHLGSLAFGSLILAIVQFIRLILKFLEKKENATGNKCVACILKVIGCCLACFERFLSFLNKNAYIEIALFGYSFCEAARKAFSLIMANIARMAAVSVVGDLLMFVGKVFICSAIGAAVFFLMRYVYTTIEFYIVVVLICVIIAWIVSSVFFAVFSMTIDTVLLCFLEDIERHGIRDENDSREKQYYMSKELVSFVDSSNTGGGCCG